jgi:Tfp pilus assembly PilM family ATPase
VYHRSGLIPLSFNTVSQAVSRSVIAEGDISTSLIVHMCENKTGLYIVRGGVVQFASIVKIGGNTITSLVQKHFKVSFEEAARIKRQKVFSKSKENSELFFSLINELSVLRDEVSKVFNYWRSHAKDKKEGAVEKVILCGEDALVSGIDRYISLVIPCEIKIANVWTNAFSPEEYVPDMPMVDSLNYAGAVGLALLTF